MTTDAPAQSALSCARFDAGPHAGSVPLAAGRGPGRRLLALLVALAQLQLLAGVVACSTNPVTGAREVVLMSKDREREIDKQASKQVEAQLGLVEDEALAEYVDRVGQAMARHSPRQDVRYHFHVVAMDEPNAFALPGGHIYVSRGLLLLSNSEAELANVLGHEIGHVAARHAAQRDTLEKTMAVMSILGQIGMAAGGARVADNYRGEWGTPGMFEYSRSQESQADEIGQDLAVAAGVDPMGMARFLQSLDASTRLERGYSRETGYFDTHPATRERAAEAATAAQVRSWDEGFAIAKTRADYLERLAGLSVGTPASEGVIDGERFLHPDLGLSMRFPRGWEIRNTRAAVIAVSPGREAVLLLELEGPGDDPHAAAMGFAESRDAHFSASGPVQIGELDAYRAQGEVPSPAGGRVLGEITWVALDGLIFRLSGFALRGSRQEGVFRSFPRGFRRLSDEERGQIAETRLHVVEARAGETLAELTERTGNAWDLNETAVANRRRPGERLEAGEPIKIAIREPYLPPVRREAGEPDSSRSIRLQSEPPEE